MGKGGGRKKRLAKLKKEMTVYGDRNLILAEMGYPSYEDYLKSDLWKGIRSAFISKYPVCKVCWKKATQIHHFTYTRENLAGTDLSTLVSICGGCHLCIEFDPKGNKRSPAGAKRAYRVRLRHYMAVGRKEKRPKCPVCRNPLSPSRPCRVCARQESTSTNS